MEVPMGITTLHSSSIIVRNEVLTNHLSLLNYYPHSLHSCHCSLNVLLNGYT